MADNIKVKVIMQSKTKSNVVLKLAERIFGGMEFLPNKGLLKVLKTFACEEKLSERLICENILFLLCGYDRPQMNEVNIT